jgi:hypothetical protein
MQPLRRRSLYGFEMREDDHRRNDAGRKTYDIKQVWQRNHEILRLALLGHKNVEIAGILNISPQTVSNTLNSQLGMEKLASMRAERDSESIEVAAEVKKLFPKALEIYEQILEDESGEASLELKLKAANTVLMDLGGHKSPVKVQNEHLHAHLTREDIEAIKRRGIEAARAQGVLIEIDDGSGASEAQHMQVCVSHDSVVDAEVTDEAEV